MIFVAVEELTHHETGEPGFAVSVEGDYHELKESHKWLKEVKHATEADLGAISMSGGDVHRTNFYFDSRRKMNHFVLHWCAQ